MIEQLHVVLKDEMLNSIKKSHEMMRERRRQLDYKKYGIGERQPREKAEVMCTRCKKKFPREKMNLGENYYCEDCFKYVQARRDWEKTGKVSDIYSGKHVKCDKCGEYKVRNNMIKIKSTGYFIFRCPECHKEYESKALLINCIKCGETHNRKFMVMPNTKYTSRFICLKCWNKPKQKTGSPGKKIVQCRVCRAKMMKDDLLLMYTREGNRSAVYICIDCFDSVKRDHVKDNMLKINDAEKINRLRKEKC